MWRASGRSILLMATIGLRPILSALRDHELGLRHRPFGRVDEHDRAVHHAQDALDLAAEIGVAGGVDDVDAGVLPDDRGRLGQDGDAALLLEIVRIHRALFHALVFAEAAGLLEQLVDEGRLAMVDVGDDGDVAQLHEAQSFKAKQPGSRQAWPRPWLEPGGNLIALQYSDETSGRNRAERHRPLFRRVAPARAFSGHAKRAGLRLSKCRPAA